MSSKYDAIKTAADLVREVQNHGLSTAQEDICRAQDIFGSSCIDELVRLANDIGRNDDQGKPDPKGTWSSDRKSTQGTFYMIAFSIWNWEDATHFWNQHTNLEHEAYQEAKKCLQVQEDKVKELKITLNREQEARATAEEEYNRLLGRCDEAERRAEAAEMEVVALKAKLYDYLMKDEKMT